MRGFGRNFGRSGIRRIVRVVRVHRGTESSIEEHPMYSRKCIQSENKTA